MKAGKNLYKLWNIFNFLVTVDLENLSATLPLTIDIEEGHRIKSLLRQAVGFDPVSVPQVDPLEGDEGDKYSADFVGFINLLKEELIILTEDEITTAIESVSEQILNDVIRKVRLLQI